MAEKGPEFQIIDLKLEFFFKWTNSMACDQNWFQVQPNFPQLESSNLELPRPLSILR